jgi:flagella basal body P-ring formation protein FlgA
MNRIFIFTIFLINSLFSYTLLSDYAFSSNLITSKDIFPNLQKEIFIYKVPENRDKIFISSRDLIDGFKKYGVELDDGGNRRIRFIRVPDNLDLERLENFIYDEFSDFYPFMEIENLSVTPKYDIENMPEDYSIIFSRRDLHHSQGYFYLETDNHDRIYFKYSINATIRVLKSSERIRKGEIIDSRNSYLTDMKFERFRSEYITEDQLGSIQAKTYIPTDRELTSRLVEKMKVVQRGSVLKGFIQDGTIYIEIEVTALEDGGIGDEIQIKSFDGKILKGKIINSKYIKVF